MKYRSKKEIRNNVFAKISNYVEPDKIQLWNSKANYTSDPSEAEWIFSKSPNFMIRIYDNDGTMTLDLNINTSITNILSLKDSLQKYCTKESIEWNLQKWNKVINKKDFESQIPAPASESLNRMIKKYLNFKQINS